MFSEVLEQIECPNCGSRHFKTASRVTLVPAVYHPYQNEYKDGKLVVSHKKDRDECKCQNCETVFEVWHDGPKLLSTKIISTKESRKIEFQKQIIAQEERHQAYLAKEKAFKESLSKEEQDEYERQKHDFREEYIPYIRDSYPKREPTAIELIVKGKRKEAGL